MFPTRNQLSVTNEIAKVYAKYIPAKEMPIGSYNLLVRLSIGLQILNVDEIKHVTALMISAINMKDEVKGKLGAECWFEVWYRETGEASDANSGN